MSNDKYPPRILPNRAQQTGPTDAGNAEKAAKAAARIREARPQVTVTLDREVAQAAVDGWQGHASHPNKACTGVVMGEISGALCDQSETAPTGKPDSASGEVADEAEARIKELEGQRSNLMVGLADAHDRIAELEAQIRALKEPRFTAYEDQKKVARLQAADELADAVERAYQTGAVGELEQPLTAYREASK